MFIPSGCTALNVDFPSNDTENGADNNEGNSANHVGERERLYVGTGDPDACLTWHGILRFENAHLIDSRVSGPVTPDGTVPIQAVTDTNGVNLNFMHGMYVHEAKDELYAACMFTVGTLVPCTSVDTSTDAGSIGVISNASKINGSQLMLRHLFSTSRPNPTQLLQPHGVWIDESRDMMYVANTFAESVLVFHDATGVTGDIVPDRVISHPDMGTPVFVSIDPIADLLFVAGFKASDPSNPFGVPAISIYDSASMLNGVIPPRVRISGNLTRLDIGQPLPHNVIYDDPTGLLYVAHHSNEILIFDLTGFSLSPPMPTQHNIAPRVIDISTSTADVNDWQIGGLFYLPNVDRLYVSCGNAGAGADSSPPNMVKVYDGVSSPQVSGRVTPTREIYWTNGATYYPPQPIWITQEPMEVAQ